MTDHLDLARDYIAKGDEYYAKAGTEILAAMDADPTLTQAEVARRVGKTQGWVSTIISARINDEPVVWRGGSNKRDEVTATTLGKADDDTLDSIVRALPPERREALREAVQRDGAQEAVDNSLDVQVARMLTQAAKVDLLLREGHTFNRLDTAKAGRLTSDLEHLEATIAQLRDAVAENSTIRRVA